ncbi:hypothetical protein ACIBG4_32740 [Nonomuraea sp. NPDC050383]|uniref:hypothetical protein n=1 Tax=Nonomuraea sp. NPDC050383 TaxID=3364362 RepID=UPI0037A32F1B
MAKAVTPSATPATFRHGQVAGSASAARGATYSEQSLPDLPFLVRVAAGPRFSTARRSCAGGTLGGSDLLLPVFLARWCPWHPQVGADDVHDGLPQPGVVLGELLQRVQAAQADRGLAAAELLDRLAEAVGVMAALAELKGAPGGVGVAGGVEHGQQRGQAGGHRQDVSSDRRQRGSPILVLGEDSGVVEVLQHPRGARAEHPHQRRNRYENQHAYDDR